MKAISRFLFVAMLAVVLAACSSNGKSPDTTLPVITLTGDNPQVLAFSDAYVELGATASDNRSGDLTASIVIDASGVDTSTPGDYSVTYNVTDAAGNAATMTRAVTVLPPVPEQALVTVEGDIKQLVFNWNEVQYTDYYRLFENADGHSGFTQVGDDIPADTLTATQDIVVHLFVWVDAQYVVEACNVTGCSASDVITATGVMLDTIGYFKASNPDPDDLFGRSVALSGDGDTLAIGTGYEDSAAMGINGNQDDSSAENAGAVYLFRLEDNAWRQQAYIKASNTDSGDHFGIGISLSADGNTLAVGSVGEDSCAVGINGDQSDDSCEDSGAVYLFRLAENNWYQEAYIKASNTDTGDLFARVAVSADGNTLAVGATGEDSSATGVNGNLMENSMADSGAVYLFRFEDDGWQQQAYLKASNTGAEDWFGGGDYWANSNSNGLALSADGNTLAVGAAGEDSGAIGINGDQTDDSAFNSGAVYVFGIVDGDWEQQAYIKASDTKAGDFIGDRFGVYVALDTEGNVLAVGAPGEDPAFGEPGAAYLFRMDGGAWYEQASLGEYGFSGPIALSGDGDTFVLGAPLLDGDPSTGVYTEPPPDCVCREGKYDGAVYLLRFDSGDWSRHTYIKASYIDLASGGSSFGGAVGLSSDGNTLVVGAIGEDSSATGINGDQTDNSTESAGAVYVY